MLSSNQQPIGRTKSRSYIYLFFHNPFHSDLCQNVEEKISRYFCYITTLIKVSDLRWHEWQRTLCKCAASDWLFWRFAQHLIFIVEIKMIWQLTLVHMSASDANKTSIFTLKMRLYRNERELMWSGQAIRVNVSCLCLCIRHCACVHV